MDHAGNLALGYNATGTSLFPSIRYAGRQASDPPNQLSQESTLITGGGSQTGYVLWGDYSQMTVDPSDDCTFWYVNGYQPSTAANQNWSTQIGAFRFPSCGPLVPGDANGDGHVAFDDFFLLVAEWGQTGPGLPADFNHDGKVDFQDFFILVQNWGK